MNTFIYATLIINIIIIGIMPKHLKPREIYVTWFVLASIAVYTDLIIGVVFDLFDYGTSPKIELSTTIIEATLAPSFGIIFTNFMPSRGKRFLLYVIYWTLFSLFYEWLTTLVHFLVYKHGWNLWCSLSFYPATCYFLRWHLRFIRGKT